MPHIAQRWSDANAMYLILILCNAQHKAKCWGAKEKPSFRCQYMYGILWSPWLRNIMTLIALAEFFVLPHKVEGLVSSVMCSACSTESGDTLPPTDQGQECSRRPPVILTFTRFKTEMSQFWRRAPLYEPPLNLALELGPSERKRVYIVSGSACLCWPTLSPSLQLFPDGFMVSLSCNEAVNWCLMDSKAGGGGRMAAPGPRDPRESTPGPTPAPP